MSSHALNGTIHRVYQAETLEITLYAVVLTVGGIGNYLVISVILMCRMKRSAPFNLYLLALAFVDLMLSVLLLLLYVVNSTYILSNDLYHRVTVAQGDLLCRALCSNYILFWLGIIESYVLVAISIERRSAIVHPFSTLTRRRCLHPLVIVALLFFLGAVAELPTMYGLKYNANREFQNFCIFSYDPVTAKAFDTTVAVLEYVIPLVIFIFCFSEVYRKLHQLQDSVLKGSLVAHIGKETSNSALMKHMRYRRRTIDTMKWVIVVFFLCLTPNIVSYVVFQYSKMENGTWGSSIYQFAVVLRFSHACFNPVLYCFISKEFRKHFGQAYPSLSRCLKNAVSHLFCSARRVQRGYSRLGSSINSEQKYDCRSVGDRLSS